MRRSFEKRTVRCLPAGPRSTAASQCLQNSPPEGTSTFSAWMVTSGMQSRRSGRLTYRPRVRWSMQTWLILMELQSVLFLY